MRRDNRRIMKDKMSGSDKVIFYSGIGVAILLIIIIALLTYANNLNNSESQELITFDEISQSQEIENDVIESIITTDETESASMEIGKTIEEAEETEEIISDSEKESRFEEIIDEDIKEEAIEVEEVVEETVSEQTVTETQQVEEKELVFQKPVEGEILRGYAKDNLVYSETLEEWVTHLGIDIKAEKTTVVQSAEVGVIKTIKNDPRYGLTVVIDHGNGFETVYSNLLSSEFVVEGEQVEKGQSIGTVGNTAPFEILDEPHLHFEILQDSIQVDPMLYLK